MRPTGNRISSRSSDKADAQNKQDKETRRRKDSRYECRIYRRWYRDWHDWPSFDNCWSHHSRIHIDSRGPETLSDFVADLGPNASGYCANSTGSLRASSSRTNGVTQGFHRCLKSGHRCRRLRIAALSAPRLAFSVSLFRLQENSFRSAGVSSRTPYCLNTLIVFVRLPFP
jgi:hypothetical protein